MNQPSALKEQKQMEQDLAQIAANMRAYLKTQSKKELIRLVMDQANLVIQHTQLNKHLHEENEKLKAQLGQQQPEAAKES